MLRVSVLELDLAALRDPFLDGRCDVALSYRPGSDQSFTARIVDSIAPHVLLHEGHQAAVNGGSVSLWDFEGEPWVALDLPFSSTVEGQASHH
ncbi:hypothetical protein DM794_06030 [Paenarthrobacter ureafaciens]|uniref:LysR substrate-binding domain-containing protein n=1 Tax=Paenarthrobacter ureafaciens TaxID=37931 RepID=UPI0015B85255|nr:hypothetical protein [Paenarthrobacter ureafaciens]